MRRLGWIVPVVLVVASTSASGCSPTFHAKACTTDDDCGDGLVCSDESAQGVCRAAADAPLRIGMSAPISGPSQDLGTEMKRGISLAFDAQNKLGGVRGRRIELDFRDDQYQPQSAEAAALDLLDVSRTSAPARCPSTTESLVAGDTPVASGALDRGPNAVLGLVGNVGTPTMVRSAPIAVETGSLFFGAFTGAGKMLRDGTSGPCARYIFNVRASYAMEARATLEYFMKLRVPDSRHLVSFDQDDTFGQAGYDGLNAAWTAIAGAPASPAIARFRYERDDESSVPAQTDGITRYLAGLLSLDGNPHVVGILMTDTYGPATSLIKGVRDWQATSTDAQKRLTIYFSNVSFVGPNSLASRLKDAGAQYANGVFVSQVVPNYETDDSDAVREYRQAVEDAGLAPSFTSLEGYLTGRVFVAGLVAHQGAFTPNGLIDTFEHLPPLGLGLGAAAGFTPDNHNYSKSVFGTAITADGDFENRYFWSDGAAIQLFE